MSTEQTTITATDAELAAAFTLWENKYRANPADFFTPEEVAAMATADLGQRQAIALRAYLREVQAAKTTNQPQE